MAAKRRKKRGPKRPGHELEIDTSGYIILVGPKSEERRLRQEVETRIFEALVRACPKRFGAQNKYGHQTNPIPGDIAFDMAWNKALFLENEGGYAMHEGKRIRLPSKTATVSQVAKLHVNYRNRRNWRQWIRIEKDRDIGKPGGPATK
jgi:hypothetical protein